MIKQSYIAITAIVYLSLWVGFCRAQGNTNASSGSYGSNGECGPFGSCNTLDVPLCSCLHGFTQRNPSDWESGNWSSDCERKVALSCGNGTTTNRFWKLESMKLSGYTSRLTVAKEQCEGVCLGNCSCIAYAFDNGIGLFAAAGKKKGFQKIFIVLPIVGFLVLCVCTYFCWKWIARRRGKRETVELGNVTASGSINTSTPDVSSRVNFEDIPLFKFEELANAADNFSEANRLGKGGFGPVYKGILASGREIAVKRLSTASGQGMQEFMNEVTLISKLQHRNLVRLVGCCAEDREKMLVYEYLPNKSLDFFLFDTSQEVLDWRKRFNIIEGICRGLLYLHRDSRLRIIHRDLKPSNILLDNDWNPKISDFGMARIFEAKQDHVSTVRVVGTYGYMAPEYAMERRFWEKSDTFSFGVLVLEIATGRRNTRFYPKEGSLNLLGHELPKDRPSVSTVLSMLSSEVIELPEPKQSAFSTKSSRPDTGSSYSQQSKSSGSLNHVTLSMVDGR
ncbi:hypothetical protein SASPL_123964 [Salvia splendens]|uniref:non-specific serine/threonine protein kinase n=1 Tax=Salvia splendens TaxID=180675 RepID=A0A8X8ZTH7_SALSN|nr:hypothetical protein SASPL_123964 [Salvia splendens]